MTAVRPGTVLLLALATVAGSVRGDPVDEAVAAQMEARHIPGLSLVVTQKGRIVREQSYGFRDLETRSLATAETVFQAASVGKSVAALGALRLVADGRLGLDEDINHVLRSWHVPGNEFTRQQPVTLRLILCHRAGLTVQGFSPGYPPGGPVPTLPQILDGLPPAHNAPVRVDAVPGKSFRYSGGGYTVMQQAMDDVTGEPFAEYMARTVFRPLGMTSSTFALEPPAAWKERIATGHAGGRTRPLKGGATLYPASAAAGLWTTAGDLARFYLGVQKALAGGPNAILPPGLARLMIADQGGNHGLGFFVGGEPLRFGHNGWHAGFCAVTVAFESGEGAVILMNSDPDVDAVADVLVKAIGKQYRWPGYPPPSQVGRASPLDGRGKRDHIADPPPSLKTLPR